MSRPRLSLLVLIITAAGACSSKDMSTAPKPQTGATTEDGQGSGGVALAWGSVIGEYKGINAYSNGTSHGSEQDSLGTYGYEYQCVEYINRFYRVALGYTGYTCGTGNMRGCGNAKDYFTNTALGLNRFPNDGSTPPGPDDIIVSTPSTFGHIAIVRSVDANGVHVIEQNWSNNTDDNDQVLAMTYANGKYHVSDWSTAYPVTGWLRIPGR